MGAFLCGLLPSLPSLFFPISSVSLLNLLLIFGVNCHCSVVENNLTRKFGFVSSSRVLFFILLRSETKKSNKPVQVWFFKLFFSTSVAILLPYRF